MRIAQVAPLAEAVPPVLYGGTERVISWLTEELVALGHDVTLFASADSRTAAKLEPICPSALRLDGAVGDASALMIVMLERVRQRAHDFDILHFHLDFHPFSLFRRQRTPLITTLHGRLDIPVLRTVFGTFPEMPLVSISNAQRLPIPSANWAGTIYHGMPVDLLTPRAGDRSYLAFLGRICPEKSVDRAIAIARACGRKIRIAAKVDPVDRGYFAEVIEPLLQLPHVEFVGEVGDAEKPNFLSGAVALLMPIDWPEPFGLVMIEAMACGTPVIAFNRGSVPEIVEDGLTGFVVEDEASAVQAVGRASGLSPATIRRRFEARFSARRMANDYLSLYRSLLNVDDRASASIELPI
jgi:glycosyltransferase involved in cell wall biosynthesis